MGNKTSNPQLDQFMQDYVKHGDEMDNRFGHVHYYHNKDQPTNMLMVKDQWTNSLTEEQNFNNILQARQNISHPNLSQCRSYNEQDDKQLTSTFHKHILAFDYHDNNLEKEILKRNSDVTLGDKRRFTEPEIWYLSNSTINADLALGREGGSYHGNVQPSSILLNDAGKVQILDNGLVHFNKSSYNRMLYDKNIKVALSPNLIAQMQERKVNPVYDQNKEDSWGVGMTTLCASTNTTLDDYYDWNIPALKEGAI